MLARLAIAAVLTFGCLHGVSAEPAKGVSAAIDPNEPVFDDGSAERIGETLTLYKDIAARGGWPVIPSDAKFTAGIVGPQDNILRQRLIASGDLAMNEGSGGYDTQVSAAVKRFQLRHGLPTTGQVAERTIAALNVPIEKRIDQLEASQTRLASLQFTFGPRYVVVNIPNASAEAVENGTVVQRYRVVVGKTDKPSPTVVAEISNVNLNPTWTVPASITKKEIAAHMRKDPAYLQRMHMRVFDGKEAELNPNSIDWSSEKAPAVIVRQDPGPWNALGQLRIDMPNAYAVYMHDTNQKHLFDADYRFDSHGCVRVDKVRDLAAWLLNDQPDWQRPMIDAAIATGERRDIKLTKKVPVAWVYLTAWASKTGVVQFRNDVYGQDEQLADLTDDERAIFDQARTN